MLYDFLKANRTELITRCRNKAAKRALPATPPTATANGIPQFIAQLIETFRAEQTPEALARHKLAGPGRPSLALVPADIVSTAAKHGNEMRLQGLSIDQVVHGYGDLCQALTELAMEVGAPISVNEFHTFNRCLDDAIADAVTSFSRGPVTSIPASDVSVPNERPTSPARELRTLVETAIHTFAAIRDGDVGLKGTTSALHEKSLAGIRDLMDRALADAPVNAGEPGQRAIVSPAAPR